MGTSTITFAVGGAKPLASYDGGSPTFNGTYEYRLHRHWSLELGIDTAVDNAPISTMSFFVAGLACPTFDVCSIYVSVYSLSASRLTVMPFGPRWVLPLHKGLVELTVGAGANHVWAAPSFGSVSTFWGRRPTSVLASLWINDVISG